MGENDSNNKINKIDYIAVEIVPWEYVDFGMSGSLDVIKIETRLVVNGERKKYSQLLKRNDFKSYFDMLWEEMGKNICDLFKEETKGDLK